MCISMSASNELVNLTFGTWLEGAFQVKIAALAAASVVIGASELSGEMLVSGLVDRLGKRRAVVIGLALNGLVVLALPLVGRTLTGALVGLFLIYLTFEFTVVSRITADDRGSAARPGDVYVDCDLGHGSWPRHGRADRPVPVWGRLAWLARRRT